LKSSRIKGNQEISREQLPSRIAALDGVRGVAVTFVVLFHFGVFPVGWVGVQIFFVLSGYLITDILLRAKKYSPLAYFIRFYWRRSLRILPVYVFFLAMVLANFAATGMPTSWPTDWPYLVTYTTNLARLRESDVGRIFVHLWSLALEEQFYLIWPFAIYFLTLDRLKICVAAVIIASPIIRATVYVVLSHGGVDTDLIGRAIYSLPFTQFDAFAFGGGIAIWRLEGAERARAVLVVSGLLAILLGCTVLLYQHFAQAGAFKASLGYQLYLLAGGGFVWGYSLIDFLVAAWLVCTLQKFGASSLLESRALTRIGVISYGIYVYHLPVLVAIEWLLQYQSRLSLSEVFIPYAALVLLASELSFRFMESPVLKFKTYLRPVLKTRDSGI
jgi:peptidoglycan/LPS O-acetylase OafA/YrhL